MIAEKTRVALVGRLARVSLYLLVAVSLFSIVGYGVFGVHPELIAHFPSAGRVYGLAFIWSARLQVLLSLVTLVLFLVSHSGMRWLPTLAAVYALSLSSELIGTTYGIPFGDYSYSALLGWKWLDRVPYLIPFSWFTMTIPAIVLARHKFSAPGQRIQRVLLGATLLAAWDLALDPAMSHLTSYWIWGETGIYYGMPAVNLFGWWVTGLVLMGVAEALNRKDWIKDLPLAWLRNYYLLVLALPIGMNAVAGAWIAVVVTALVAGALLWWTHRSEREIDAPARDSESGAASSARLHGNTGRSRQPEHVVAATNVDTGAEHGWEYFRQHSRSFSFSSRLLGRRHREDVSRLYALCRITDDIADGRFDAGPVSRRDMLSVWHATVMASYRHSNSGYAWLDGITNVLRERGMSEQVLEDFFAGICSDLGSVRLKNRDELMGYGYQVASTVGVMMCYLFGVRDEWRLNRAIALGQAMQLTNIIRDVGEDLERDRIYLPESLLLRHGLSGTDLKMLATDSSDEGRLARYRSAIRELVSDAEAQYEHAWEAIPKLPGRFGATVAVAASVYRAIHRKLDGKEHENLTGRVWTSNSQKLALAISGLGKFAWLSIKARVRGTVGGASLVKHRVAESSTSP